MRLGEASEQEQQRRLYGMWAELANVESVQDVSLVLADVGAIVLGAARVRLWTADPTVARLIDPLATYTVDLTDFVHPVVQAIITGQPLWSSRFSTGSEANAEQLGRSVCVLPLIAGGAVTGAIEMAFATTRFTGADRAFLLAVAGQVADAVDRVRLAVVESWPTGSTQIKTIEAMEPDPIAPCRRTVMIVDDDADAAAGFCAALEALGHEVVVVFNEPAALRIAEQLFADVVFVDLGLSTGNAYELAGHLRACPGWDSTRVIAMAANERSNARERAREAGFDELALKPLDRATIDTLLA